MSDTETFKRENRNIYNLLFVRSDLLIITGVFRHLRYISFFLYAC